MRAPLPIDAALDDITSHATRDGAVVVVAAPGAGKSTRVPAALEARVPGQVLVLEPRRLAARLLAERVAHERGERPGASVGYAMRFERAGDRATRLWFLTEGVLVRRLASDPSLEGVSAVVLDEFHERHVDTDVCLGMLVALRRSLRPDLAIVVMSATIDPGPVAALLGARVVHAEGRTFPIEIEHLPRSSDEPLERLVAQGVARAVRETSDGHVLVFLPGAAEIRRATEALAPVAAREGLAVLPLHGSLSRAEQDRALAPSERRKVIVSTNVAETSLTIEGVRAVVDAGLARVAKLSSRGVPTLEVRPVSKASAAQRAGRAGRTSAGRAYRLYTQGDLAARPDEEAPEVTRDDLAPAALLLAASGHDLATFPWLTRPPEAALEAARALLLALGALDPSGAGLTPVGRDMLRYPLHPRAARVLVAALELGLGAMGARLAAALTEGSPFRRGTARERPRQPSDVLEWALAVDGPRDDARAAREGLDPVRARALRELTQRLERAIPRGSSRDASPHDEEAASLPAIAAGYPDRVARVRPPPAGGTRHRPELLLASGGSAELDELESTWRGDLCVVIELEQRAQGRSSAPLVRAASSVSEEWVLLERTSDVRDVVTLSLDEASGAVVELRRMTLGALVLEETKGPPRDLERAREVLADALLAKGPEVLGDAREAAFRLAGRLETARAHVPEAGLPAMDDGLLRVALVHAAAASLRVSEVTRALRASLYELSLSPAERALLDELCPEHVTIGAGRRARVEYAPGKPPSLASRMQDFFGSRDGPRVCRGRAPVVLELLAPNGRAVQVTTELSGFWERHYPAIARELRRKYPRHPFPDDPRSALPPAPRRRP